VVDGQSELYGSTTDGAHPATFELGGRAAGLALEGASFHVPVALAFGVGRVVDARPFQNPLTVGDVVRPSILSHPTSVDDPIVSSGPVAFLTVGGVVASLLLEDPLAVGDTVLLLLLEDPLAVACSVGPGGFSLSLEACDASHPVLAPAPMASQAPLVA
jgi:hypothetical protein